VRPMDATGRRVRRGSGRLRLRRRRLLLVTVVGIVLAGMATSVSTPASADDSNGVAIMWINRYDYTIEWGQDVEVAGYIDDESQSCLVPPFDCDTPTGTITMSGVNHTIDYGSGPVTEAFDDPGANYALFDLTIPYNKFDPGVRYVVLDYSGNFDDYESYIKVTVNKQTCHAFSLSQNFAGSQPGQPVTLTADLGSDGHQGTISIFDDNGLLDTTNEPANGRTFSTTTSAMPQGDSSYYATYSGDGFHEGCTSTTIHHTVSADAIPTALDDTASVDVGSSVLIPVLDNDSDDNPGLRPEILNNPDFGDFEKVGNSYLYTPDPNLGNYQDSFDYFDYDSIGQSSAPAHVVVNVGCTPFAADDQYSVRQMSTLHVPDTDGVRKNDDTCDGSPVSVETGPSHGTLTLAEDGSFTYDAADDYSGPDHFTYQYTDLLDTPVTARVDLQVVPYQVPPNPLPPPDTTTSTTTTTTEPTTTSTSTTTTTEPTTTSTSTTTTEPTTTSTSTTTTEPTTTSTSTTTSSTTTTTTSPTTTTTTMPTTTTTTTIPPTTGAGAVTTLYDALFDRSPDASGMAHWAPQIDAGATPLDIARSLVISREFRRRMVAQAYESCLGREPDPAGLAYWTDRLAHVSPDVVRTGLLGSNEAWNHAGRDPSTWIDQVFQALLGRHASTAEILGLVPRVEAGERRSTLARQIAHVPEARRHLAQIWYPLIAKRVPTDSEIDAWAAAMATGRTERSLIAELAASRATPSA
jgi:hypothetical protein